MKDKIHKDDLDRELNKLMNKKSENESSEDDLLNEETLRTADASRLKRPRINSTIEEEIRVNTQPEDEPSTNEGSKA